MKIIFRQGDETADGIYSIINLKAGQQLLMNMRREKIETLLIF